uniref:Tudor domain-containing protein n=1 Tax=Caenorhabditis tropicalis TaxID=1561998 RepID=A0A1I7U304_9PELO
MEEELATYKLQLQQVEAALLGDPDNVELHKLKDDLTEIIELQEDLQEKDKAESSEKGVIAPQVIHKWTIGERVIAPHPDGKKVFARIDSLTPAGVAITFTSTGTKTIVDPSDLQLPPENQRKNYAFDNTKSAAGPSNQHGKKEWQAEKERRRQKALKKQQKQKELDSIKDGEKKSWQKFNTKANAKGLKGLKKISATGSSQDGSASGDKRGAIVSSRSNQFSFKATRGAMDSLF